MLSWSAPAKINLFLHVVGQFDDGYHELQTVYQLLDWCDELEFECTCDGSISRSTKIKNISEANDVTIRAARLLRMRFPGPQGVRIKCNKQLPVGAGLGGGSSCAAATLCALNELWQLGLKQKDLATIGLEIGADVPVFIYGKNAWAEGRGEQLTDISIPQQLYLLVYPACSVSTARVFRTFSQTPRYRPKLSIGEFGNRKLNNDLEAIACQLYPEVGILLEWLKNWGEPRMSGSGSSSFLPIDSRKAGEDILAELPAAWTGRICVGRNK